MNRQIAYSDKSIGKLKTDELHGAVTGEDMFRYLEADQQFHLYLVSLTGTDRAVFPRSEPSDHSL